MSAAAGSDSKTTVATAAKPMVLKDVLCDDCNKFISDCMCVTAPTHARYCDTCGRARPYCICGEAMCGGCDRTTADCLCGKCRTCGLRSDKCVCPCATCKYPGDKCRCYEEYEPHPDTLCCPHCYSDPCECEAEAKRRDRNASKEYDCPRCGDSAKYCQCNRDSDDED